MADSFWFGGLNITSVLCADDLLVSSVADLQPVLEQFAGKCETSGTRISTLKSDAMVIYQKSARSESEGSWSPKWKSLSTVWQLVIC